MDFAASIGKHASGGCTNTANGTTTTTAGITTPALRTFFFTYGYRRLVQPPLAAKMWASRAQGYRVAGYPFVEGSRYRNTRRGHTPDTLTSPSRFFSRAGRGIREPKFGTQAKTQQQKTNQTWGQRHPNFSHMEQISRYETST